MQTQSFEERPHVYRPGTGPVLLMLHGTGGNETDIVSLADALDPDAAVLSPRGTVTENGMLRFFRRMGEGVFDVDDVIAKAGDLAGFVTWAREHYELGDRPMIAVGFSNGANIGLALGMLHPDVIQRVIAFSGMYPFADRPTPLQLEGSRMLVLGGDADAMAPAASGDRLEAELTRVGAAVERQLRAGGHGIAEQEVARARAWLSE